MNYKNCAIKRLKRLSDNDASLDFNPSDFCLTLDEAKRKAYETDNVSSEDVFIVQFISAEDIRAVHEQQQKEQADYRAAKEYEQLHLEDCEQCGDRGCDGHICHCCGAKDI